MKITNAWIDDPTLRGKLAKPELCIEVDSEPVSTIPDEAFAGGWTVGKYGPLVKFTAPEPVDAGDFNVRFRNRFPVVVDVTLFRQCDCLHKKTAGCDHEDGQLGYSLLLTRARQCLRKFDPSWRLHVSDRAAENGQLIWVPVQFGAGCRQWLVTSPSKGATCGRTPARPIKVGEIDLVMCERHIRENNERHAALRVEASSR